MTLSLSFNLSFRIYGGTVSMPTEDTNDHVMQKLKDRIKEGVYTIGEKVVPQVFKKLALRDGNTYIEKSQSKVRNQN